MAADHMSAERLRYAEKFNHNIKTIARDLARQFPNDAMAARMQKRVGLAIGLDPLMLIKLVGPKLYAYREQISSNDVAAEEFALTHSFGAEISAADADGAEAASHFIPLVQQYLRNASAAEKKAYRDLVVELLDCYLEFTP